MGRHARRVNMLSAKCVCACARTSLPPLRLTGVPPTAARGLWAGSTFDPRATGEVRGGTGDTRLCSPLSRGEMTLAPRSLTPHTQTHTHTHTVSLAPQALAPQTPTHAVAHTPHTHTQSHPPWTQPPGSWLSRDSICGIEQCALQPALSLLVLLQSQR